MVLLGGVSEREIRMVLVVVPVALPVTREVPSLLELADDPMRRPLGDPHGLGDGTVTLSMAGVAVARVPTWRLLEAPEMPPADA